MRTIRIGSGAGFGGDRIEPALAVMEHGQIDYIIFECLAERTIALAQQHKATRPEKGYNEERGRQWRQQFLRHAPGRWKNNEFIPEKRYSRP